MIAIVDYGAGNLHSVSKALAALGLEARVTGDPGEIEAARAVVLPGVGAFGDCMGGLRERGLVETVRRAAGSGRPFLGICLGMQLLFEWGEEGDGGPGLGLLPGRVVRLEPEGLKIPQMGWNSLQLTRPSPLWEEMTPGTYVYFVHSYHARPADPSVVAATVDYGGEVVAAVERGNLFGVQFHPEKSGRAGL